MSFLEELEWRGLLHQTTAGEELERHLREPGRVGYCGFDPTADSLTIANFIPIKLLMHWQRAGHKPLVIMGGGTGLIGDPSGKDAERQLLGPEQVEANIAGQRPVFERLLDFDPGNPRAAVIINNAQWLEKLGYLEALRDIGKHFSVNAMIQKDSVRERLRHREQGISYTEFSYMLLQAYDFLHLYRTMGCTVQLAGSDQYGNIVSGIDLIRRLDGESSTEPRAFGITNPLITRSDGKKIGKTEKGAVWLTADRTSAYAFYQYWINVDDADVAAFLKWFTFLGREEIEEIRRQHARAPEQRLAQQELARQMTRLVHGEEQLGRAEAASRALFTGEVRSLSEQMLAEVLADVPHSGHERSLLQGEGLPLVELLPRIELARSKSEARHFLGTGAVSVNGEKAAADRRLNSADLLHGRTILIKRGRKSWHATEWE
jgi:tyrosyl-tRNA synthetase